MMLFASNLYPKPRPVKHSGLILTSLLLCGWAFIALPTMAQKTTNPSVSTPSSVQVEADRLEYQAVTHDQAAGKGSKPTGALPSTPSTLVLLGNVSIHHLKSNMTADRVEVVESNPDVNPPERTFDARGTGKNLVHFNHQAEPTPTAPNPAPVSGQALRITYNAASQIFVLLGQAQLWQGNDHISANTIRYFAQTGQYFADSTNATSNQAPSRVKIEFFPAATPSAAQ